MKETFVIIGLGRFGSSIAERLNELKKEIVCIDKNETVIRELSEKIQNIYQADCLDGNSLREIGISESDTVVVSIGENLETSIMCVATLHGMGIKKIYAKAVNKLHGRILAQVGAKRVIFPEKEMGTVFANSLAGIDIIEKIGTSNKYIISKIKAPKQFCDKTIKQLDIRNRYNINIISVDRDGKIDINPYPDDILMENDILTVVGKKKDIEQLIL